MVKRERLRLERFRRVRWSQYLPHSSNIIAFKIKGETVYSYVCVRRTERKKETASLPISIFMARSKRGHWGDTRRLQGSLGPGRKGDSEWMLIGWQSHPMMLFQLWAQKEVHPCYSAAHGYIITTNTYRTVWLQYMWSKAAEIQREFLIVWWILKV